MHRLIFLISFLIPFFSALAQTKPEEETIYTYVEQMPEFPGGQVKMMEYIAQNIRYPQEALMQQQEGIVFVTFVVDKKGQLTQTAVLKSAAPSLDAEAIRVCKTMPKWQPGKQNGQEVAVKFTLPVRFRIDDKKPAVISSAEADLAPQFPGGEKALINYMSNSIEYPASAYAKQIKGNVVISFTVDEKGSLTEPRIESSPAASFSEEAIRVVSAMPAWKPAMKNGQAVAVRHALSIPFSLKMPLQYAAVHNDMIIDGNKIQNQPQFPGGLEGMMYYLSRNIIYPPDAQQQGIEGRVILSFIIDNKGNIKDISILQSIFPSLDAEAKRAISNMPRWNPGKVNGKPVNVRFTLPVLFSMKKDAPVTNPK